MKNLMRPGDLSGYVVLDARFRLQYPEAAARLFEEGHIPGAQRVDLEKDLSGEKTGKNGRHPLPSRAALRGLFSRLGIGPDTPVVVYDDTDHAGAARAWMLLRWMGHEKVWVLEGGLQAWKDSGRPLEKGPAHARARAEFPDRAPLVELLGKEALGGRRLVDARAPERYRGEVEPLDAKAGHIPGAENLFYQTLLKNGRFLVPEKLRSRLREEAVFYCGSGVTAAVLLLAAEEAGFKGALYPGSWSEWSRDPQAAVETGEYRRGVVGVIQNERGEVLLFERSDQVNSWQFPQGGIDGEETGEEALHRELFEEVGVKGAKVIRRGDFTTTYDWIKGEKKGRRGQRHWWFLCEISGEPNLARGDGSFSAYEWVKPERVVERVVDWKQEATRLGLASLHLL